MRIAGPFGRLLDETVRAARLKATVLLAWTALVACPSAVPAAEGEPTAPRDTVVATVGDEPIYARDVNRLLEKIVEHGQVNAVLLPRLRARLLAEIIDRRLVMAYAARTNSAVSAAQIDAVIGEMQQQLRPRGQSLADVLEERSITESDLRRDIAWRLVWKKYAAKYITGQRLAAHFQVHRREFDGTGLSVSHVLLQPAADDEDANMDTLMEKARAIRESIVAGKTSFADAARRFSTGPSAENGGKLGTIARHGAMVEAFSRAAFALDVGDISQPVRTQFGVHLIRVDAIKPGQKKWTDVRERLQAALGRELIGKLARIERQHTPVKFTGMAPYFESNGQELVVP